ncbi:MAG TPA: M1 family aminopeptidase [Candidatus Sulfopaludibacter sp.]|jgi:ABC-type transport system involved in multi-copper enzyme maturation permease subunit|nr:M1 family aminopeptidase [Candidatus Sulfopaludibacter sp.]
MWRHLALFEIRYWTRSWLVWLFLLLTTGLAVWGCTSNEFMARSGNFARNAGYVIEDYYSVFALFTLLMATVFVNSSATRDFATRSDQIVFSTPIRKWDYLCGRFLGAACVAAIPMLGVSLGVLLGRYAWWGDGDYQAINWAAHACGILLFALPNTFFIAAILFAVAVFTRSGGASFVSAICLLTGFRISHSYLSDLKNERISALLDPFGGDTFRYVTRYWTSAEKGHLIVGFHGLLVWNRLLWLAVGLGVFLYACARFRFAPRQGRAPVEEDFVPPPSAPLPKTALHPARLTQLGEMVRHELQAIVRTRSFLVILLAGLSIMLINLIGKATEGYGNSSFPVTYKVVELLQTGLILFDVAVVLYFAGAAVWRERDSGVDETLDALPVPEWIFYVSKLMAVLLPMLAIEFAGMVAGILVQAAHGYFRFQLDVYTVQLFGLDFLGVAFLAVLALFFHVVSPYKYVAWFGFPIVLTLDQIIWKPLNVVTSMVQFGDVPDVVYSDFFGWQPYRAVLVWYSLYWLAFCVVVALVTMALWRRGRETRWKHRAALAVRSLRGPMRGAVTVAAVVWLATFAVVFYNTKILNTTVTDKDLAAFNARYEKAYKRYEHLPQPKIISAKYTIDLMPESSSMKLHCEELIQNKTAQPIDRLYIDYVAKQPHRIIVDGTKLVSDDPDLGFRILQFTPPLQPGETRRLIVETGRARHGFENGPGDLSVVSNGTFFNTRVMPRIGYHRDEEVDEDRAKYSLPAREELPEPSRNCTADCANNYLERAADWVDVESTVSTAPDQIAIAPGSLVREWRANGRRYFEYRLDHRSVDFYSFLSARYQVDRTEWNGVEIEVYYLKEQPWNVARMRQAGRQSLDYYVRNFGPYEHREARIIEFPRISSFAQSFPGSMPYSESIGFIANLTDPGDIDHVFYVVAHEMAHQWWAHQVIGAEVQGATLLSESLAQYSALMVMEKAYGREMIRKFLRYETDIYLKGRANDKKPERPLLATRDDQLYVRYNKASAVFYQMREMIGEEGVNRALRKVLARYRYAEPPYPTSYALVDALREETPPQLRYVIADLFENVTLYSNSVSSANATQRPDGKFDVTMDVQFLKLRVDGQGKEIGQPPGDWVEIGAFANDKLIHLERVFVQHASQTFRFTVNQKPNTAALDPLGVLIDRTPDRTKRKVE